MRRCEGGCYGSVACGTDVDVGGWRGEEVSQGGAECKDRGEPYWLGLL